MVISRVIQLSSITYILTETPEHQRWTNNKMQPGNFLPSGAILIFCRPVYVGGELGGAWTPLIHFVVYQGLGESPLVLIDGNLGQSFVYFVSMITDLEGDALALTTPTWDISSPASKRLSFVLLF